MSSLERKTGFGPAAFSVGGRRATRLRHFRIVAPAVPNATRRGRSTEPLPGADPGGRSLPRIGAHWREGRELGKRDSDAHLNAPKACGLPLPHSPSEPPPGAGPGLAPYKGAVTAVCGGLVPPAGFEPALYGPSDRRLCRWATRACEPPVRTERTTCFLRGSCSATELWRRGWGRRDRTSTSVTVSRSRAGRVAYLHHSPSSTGGESRTPKRPVLSGPGMPGSRHTRTSTPPPVRTEIARGKSPVL